MPDQIRQRIGVFFSTRQVDYVTLLHRGLSSQIINQIRPFHSTPNIRFSYNFATAGHFLTDQLLLPMALAGGGSFVATDWSSHTATNADIVQRFLSIEVQTLEYGWGKILVQLIAK